MHGHMIHPITNHKKNVQQMIYRLSVFFFESEKNDGPVYGGRGHGGLCAAE